MSETQQDSVAVLRDLRERAESDRRNAQSVPERETYAARVQAYDDAITALQSQQGASADRGEAWAADDFYSGHPLPVLHDDPTINLELLVQALTARLDTARRALADAAAMQVAQPPLQQVKANAAWAMDETDPRRLLPRSVAYAASRENN